jgi:hypothetical protein
LAGSRVLMATILAINSNVAQALDTALLACAVLVALINTALNKVIKSDLTGCITLSSIIKSRAGMA